jgi:hypothetical protein
MLFAEHSSFQRNNEVRGHKRIWKWQNQANVLAETKGSGKNQGTQQTNCNRLKQDNE